MPYILTFPFTFTMPRREATSHDHHLKLLLPPPATEHPAPPPAAEQPSPPPAAEKDESSAVITEEQTESIAIHPLYHDLTHKDYKDQVKRAALLN